MKSCKAVQTKRWKYLTRDKQGFFVWSYKPKWDDKRHTWVKSALNTKVCRAGIVLNVRVRGGLFDINNIWELEYD